MSKDDDNGAVGNPTSDNKNNPGSAPQPENKQAPGSGPKSDTRDDVKPDNKPVANAPKPVRETPDGKVICPGCGKILAKGTLFCGMCGYRL